MSNVHRSWTSGMSSRSGPANKLAMTVLDDDAVPSGDTKAVDDSTAPQRPPQEQIVMLCQAALAISDLPTGLFFLGQYPWIAQSHPAIADLILRIVDHALQPVYSEVMSPYPDRAVNDDFLMLQEGPRWIRHPELEVQASIMVPLPPDTTRTAYQPFYPEWSADLEVWSTVEEIREKGLRWLSLIRGLGGRNSIVMVKICRIGATIFAMLKKEAESTLGLPHPAKSREELHAVQVSLDQSHVTNAEPMQPDATQMKPWLEVIRVILLPAMSASGATAAFDVELWNLIKYFPYAVRYALYGEWRDVICNFSARGHDPIAAQAAAECIREIKKALSRVTAAQSGGGGSAAVADRGPARQLAKLSHTNPCALWTTAVSQVRSYSNIGGHIVEAGRYMTQLAMDVAAFTIVDSLSNDMIPRLDPTGTQVASWLESKCSHRFYIPLNARSCEFQW